MTMLRVLMPLRRPYDLLRTYRRADLLPDIIAGATVGIVLLPQALAFPLLAGLPPTVGLFAAVVAPLIAALWGSSAHLQTGPTNTASILTLSALLPVAALGTPEYLAAAGLLAVLSGLIRLAFGLARLGVLINFVSSAVAVGFTAGAGILIIANQLGMLLRIAVGNNPSLFGTLAEVGAALGTTHLPSLAVGITTVLVILATQRLAPRVPALLVGIVATGVGVWLLGLEAQGVQVLGELPAGLPPLAALPFGDLALVGSLANGALAIAVIGLVEASSIARSIAGHSEQRLDSNQEFVGQGLANIAAGLFSGYACSGSFNRSALSYRAGGRTALTAVFSAIFVLLATLLLAPLTAHLPRAALAGALILTAWGMVDRKSIRQLWRSARGDATIMSITLVLTLLLPLQFAVLAGVLMSLGYYILQTSAPQVRVVLPDAQYKHWVPASERLPCPELGVIEVLGNLYFGAVNHVEEAIRRHADAHPTQRFLLIRMENVLHIDSSGVQMLETLVRLYRARRGQVYLTQVRAPVRAFLRSTGFLQTLGEANVLETDAAIGYLFNHVIDPAICIYECEVRAFRECQNLPKRLLPGVMQTVVESGPPPVMVAARDLYSALRSANPPVVLDVREPREFARGHIPQARSLPLLDVLAGAPDLLQNQDIVLACRSGRRSARAASALRSHGFTELRVLAGGMLAWEADHLLEAVDV